MNHDAPEGWPRGGEWNWLWEAYVVGLAVVAIVAVVLLGTEIDSHGGPP